MTIKDIKILTPLILQLGEFEEDESHYLSVMDRIASYCIVHDISPSQFNALEKCLLGE